MEHELDAMEMLDLMVQPGFCVKDNTIVKTNHPAAALNLCAGDGIFPLLHTGKEEYSEFSGGCLYLSLMISGQEWGASVSRVGDFDVFILEQEDDLAELQAMALAARELREPLTAVMTTADRLFPMSALEDDPATRDQVARLNRGLFQMLRVISNMSDAGRYSQNRAPTLETRDICAFLTELFAKAEALVTHTGIQLHFFSPDQSIFCLVDSEMLERAVLNIVSNAMKFTPAGGTIEGKLTRRGSRLYLSVRDTGDGIPNNLRGSIHSRYLRQPAIEDSRFGIGLGMVLIRSTASRHGGTVLIDQPENGGTRITMTLQIRQNPQGTVRSNVLLVDYAGERDHGLIELSDALPASLYESRKIN